MGVAVLRRPPDQTDPRSNGVIRLTKQGHRRDTGVVVLQAALRPEKSRPRRQMRRNPLSPLHARRSLLRCQVDRRNLYRPRNCWDLRIYRDKTGAVHCRSVQFRAAACRCILQANQCVIPAPGPFRSTANQVCRGRRRRTSSLQFHHCPTGTERGGRITPHEIPRVDHPDANTRRPHRRRVPRRRRTTHPRPTAVHPKR